MLKQKIQRQLKNNTNKETIFEAYIRNDIGFFYYKISTIRFLTRYVLLLLQKEFLIRISSFFFSKIQA